MNMSVFYHLDAGENSFVDYGYTNDWDSIVCPLDPGHQRSSRRISTLGLEVVRRRVVDFSNPYFADIVITDRVLQTFEKAGLTGFRAEPTKIERVRKNCDKSKIPLLWELIITGSGHVHPDSGIRLLRHCDGCGLDEYSAHEHRITIDESQWDGSDFFTVIERPSIYLVTERVKQVILENEFTNVRLIPSHLIKWPKSLSRPE
jgi:hypothetical protein